MNNSVLDSFVPTETVPQRTNRIFELDALRALAAINLMLFHFTWVYSEKYGFTSDIAFKYAYGKYGTQLFFMLSGLVNALTLLKKQSATYYIHSRAVRILPPFLLVLGLNLLLVQFMPLRDHVQLSAQSIAANATMLPNLLGYECIEPVTWTLQVEVQFYFVFLLLFISGALRRPFWPLMTCLAFCCVFRNLAHYLDAAVIGETAFGVMQWFRAALIVDYFPLFAMGIFIHLGYLERTQWLKNGIGVLTAAAVYHSLDLRGTSIAATLMLLGLLLACQYGKLPILRIKPLLFISGISYSLYLLHNNLGTVMIYYLNHAGIPPLACFAIAMVAVVPLSAAAAYWIERPLGRWIRGLLNLWSVPKDSAQLTQCEPNTKHVASTV